MPNEVFSVTLSAEGVYDFFCIPHEHAGMAGRIIVGEPGRSPAQNLSTQAAGGEPIPDIALHAPSIDEIMRQGIIRRA